MNDPVQSTQILVIDDERDIREGCERILSRMECKVFIAANGMEGLEIINREPISIVLCDIKMPGIDGIEVLSRIRESKKEILVIMITGFATVETAIEAMKRGAYDFVSKPFTPDQLRIVVKRAIEKLRLIQETEALRIERERNLADLGMEQSRIRTIIETLPNGVLVTNMTGQVVLLNPVAIKYLGIDVSRKTGEQIGTYLQDKGLCDYIMAISQGAYRITDDIPSYELVLPEERYVLVQGRPVPGAGNECLGAVVNLADITAMKVFDRLKSEFVAKVSHELRSPLSTIHEQLAMVIQENAIGYSEDSQYMLGRAKEKTQGLIALIGDLLDLSRIEAGNVGQNPVPVQVDDIVERVVEFLKVQAQRKEQQLVYKPSAVPVAPILADAMAIESIFGNIITNAIKYTPDKGKIIVTVEALARCVSISVEDTGFGMEKKHLPRIFEKFYRVKDENTRFITGTGLGLPIVKSLVEALNGTISVESELGKGTIFTVTVPYP